MRAYDRKRFFPFVSIILLACAVVYYLFFRTACSGISCVYFSGKASWSIQDVYENGKKSWRGMLHNADRQIRLELIRDVTKAEADEFTKIRLMMTEGVYDTQKSPYPGAISATIRCDDVYKPHPEVFLTNSGLPVTYFSAGLNNRLQYGVCVDTQIAYKSDTGFYYCENTRMWVHVEMITLHIKGDTKEFGREFFQTVTCR